MTLAPLHLHGERLMLDPAGALLWPARRLMALADLHLEKGAHFASKGQFLPPYDSAETLARLQKLLRRHTPQRLLLLGDSFHHATCRLSAKDAQTLAQITQGIAVTWLLGNHDPALPKTLPGEALPELNENPFTFRHIPTPTIPQGAEIAGHFHPKATMNTRAGPITRPCFATGSNRIILPAFGAYTGGLDIADPAIAPLFPRGGRAFLIGEARLFSFPIPPRRGALRSETTPPSASAEAGPPTPIANKVPLAPRIRL